MAGTRRGPGRFSPRARPARFSAGSPLSGCIGLVYCGAGVDYGGQRMSARKGKKTKMKTQAMPRASVSFPSEIYRTLEQIAKQKKVSVAWVVREAAEKYVSDMWPLLSQSREQ